MSLYSELKRRNVFRVAVAYLAAAWLLTEVASTLFPLFGVPDWGTRFVVIFFALGFFPSLFFSWVYEITPEGLKREVEVVRDESIVHVTAKRLDGITIALILLVLVFVVVDRLWLSTGTIKPQEPVSMNAEQARPGQDGTTESSPHTGSIAVLPFVNMSDDPANEYFSDGISEELLNLLAKIPGLRVISRSSAFSFKGTDMKIPDIASELNVAHILEGSVRKEGRQVRITAQLIEARSDMHLWSEAYDRTLDNIFAIQDEIASTVVAELKLRLLDVNPGARTSNPEAYELFLQARYLINRGSIEGYEKATGLLTEALQKDSSYASAWSELHRAYVNQVGGMHIPREEGLKMAHEAIDRAIELNPDDAVALSRLGWFEMKFEADLAAAAQHFERAISLDPGNTIVLANAAGLLEALDRLEPSIMLQEYVLQRDPLSSTTINNLAGTLFVAGRLDEAEAMARKALSLSPGNVAASRLLARVLYNKGDLAGAQQLLNNTSNPMLRQMGMALIHKASGETAQFNAILQNLIDAQNPILNAPISLLYGVQGRNDEAFRWLQLAIDHRGREVLINAKHAPELESLREDPRFEDMLERYGLTDEQLAAIHFEVNLPIYIETLPQ